jgi:hypothetical protein
MAYSVKKDSVKKDSVKKDSVKTDMKQCMPQNPYFV